ncbi:unnamed protein product [Parajaminaea phylloscopi]
MTITTLGAARHITPTVIRTFFKHWIEQAKKDREDRHLEATDELLFHEAFQIVKRFIQLATSDTVEAIQAFTNTRIPTPPRATVVPALIPLSSCDRAAKAIIDYFGPEDLQRVVGGEKWWQVRGLNGVEAQWVSMTNDWKKARIVEEWPEGDARARAAKYAKYNQRHERKTSGTASRRREKSQAPGAEPLPEDDAGEEDNIAVEELDRLRRVLLYIHGGGYYFGSFTTHAYQIIRLARKMGGRAFAPIYRKAPGYPWPAPLQDCLAAYFYLIDPPPEAKHKAVDPKNIILAGDSAGGGMCLAMLGVLRDLGLPMPAGAVLISPWCDMTHSFPSILENTETDIIPTYGFVHKPSTLWPLPAEAAGEDESRLKVPTGVTDQGGDARSDGDVAAAKVSVGNGREPEQRQRGEPRSAQKPPSTGVPPPTVPLSSETFEVKMSDGTNVELKQQIQLYATNSQLYHPLCSPILQGSLGGLPPLHIIAGDSEVLRDEVIMLAHRAARPDKYPLPDHLLAKNAHARETAARFNSQPTKVHLQVFDYQCHVLTLFSFTTAARYAYRAIASFCKYVTNAQTTVIDNPFPELREEASGSSSVFSARPEDTLRPSGVSHHKQGKEKKTKGQLILPEIDTTSPAEGNVTAEPELAESPTKVDSSPDPSTRPTTATQSTGDRRREGSVSTHATTASRGSQRIKPGSDARQQTMEEKRRKVTLGVANDYSGQVPLKRPEYREHMIRERVDVRGAVRPLEEEEQLQAIRLFVDHPEQIGVIREGPVKRYLEGQGLWDSKFKRTAKKVEKKRKANEELYERILEKAVASGKIGPHGGSSDTRGQARPREWVVGREEGASGEEWVDEARYGPVDVALSGETPPPSALAGRRDCDDAVTLLRTSLHLSAREAGVRSRRAHLKEGIAGEAPTLSTAEAQHRPRGRRMGMHGLSLWNKWMGRFTKRAAYFDDASTTTPEQEAADKNEAAAEQPQGSSQA